MSTVKVLYMVKLHSEKIVLFQNLLSSQESFYKFYKEVLRSKKSPPELSFEKRPKKLRSLLILTLTTSLPHATYQGSTTYVL